jgi:hypothetical protein
VRSTVTVMVIDTGPLGTENFVMVVGDATASFDEDAEHFGGQPLPIHSFEMVVEA